MKKVIFFAIPVAVSGQLPAPGIFNSIGYTAVKQHKASFGRPAYGQLTFSQDQTKKIYQN